MQAVGITFRNSLLSFSKSSLSRASFSTGIRLTNSNKIINLLRAGKCSLDADLRISRHLLFSPLKFNPIISSSQTCLGFSSSRFSSSSSSNGESTKPVPAHPTSPAESPPAKPLFDPRAEKTEEYYSGLEKFAPAVQPMEPSDSPPNQTLWSKFKDMYKKYWYVLVPVHLVLSAAFFGFFYLLAVQGVDVIPLLEKLGVSEGWIEKLRKTGAGFIAAAFVMYKISAPLRYSATLGVTTLAINILRKRGIIKPVPSAKQMKKMFDEQKIRIFSKRAARITKIKERLRKEADAFRKFRQSQKPAKD